MEEKNPIQVADRLFHTVELLSDNRSMGLMEISQSLKLNKSTVHRVLNSLIHMGYVKQDQESGKYELTFKIVEIANNVMSRVDIAGVVRPYLRRLMELTNETVHFVELDGVDAVYIDKVESYSNSIQMVSRIGSRIPLYRSGVGKAMAAQMKEAEIKEIWDRSEIVQMTPYTITDYDEFKSCLKVIKERGYALDNEENEAGVRCIAASLPNKNQKAHYAFSISAPVIRMDHERLLQLSEYVLDTKEKIRKELPL